MSHPKIGSVVKSFVNTRRTTWKQQCLTGHLTRLASRTSEKTSIPHISWTGPESDHSKQFIEAFNHEHGVITSFAVPEPNPMHDSDEWVEFKYDLDTKSLTGGSYYSFENKKPWWKIW